MIKRPWKSNTIYYYLVKNWQKKFVLKNCFLHIKLSLNFSVKKGELVAVVGTVGSGKSSLLSSLLGEMYKFNGTINVNGTISYVPQQAWIQNATVK